MDTLNAIRMFVRVYELQNMSAAARDMNVSAAVASSRIADLERHLDVALFTRTTRSVRPTSAGRVFYPKALTVLSTLDDAQASVSPQETEPSGCLNILSHNGLGKRLIAPHIPAFHEAFPKVRVRLRLSDREFLLTEDGIDMAVVLGKPVDAAALCSSIAPVERVLCAAPSYIARRGKPRHGADLLNDKHDCLVLRFPGSTEFRWQLETETGPQSFDLSGPFSCDDSDVLTQWALDGQGIVNRPIFDVAEHLQAGRLVPVCAQTPPPAQMLTCAFSPQKAEVPKVAAFIEFMCERIKSGMADKAALYVLPR